MPAQRLSMRRIRELLRLRFGAMASDRAIARALGVARSTVQDYLARAAAAGLTWPLPDELSDEALEEQLFASAGPKPGFRRRIEPDWAALVPEMKRPGVNLTVLWEEYREAHPGGYGYSRYVAAKNMLRAVWSSQGNHRFPWLNPEHIVVMVLGPTELSETPSMTAAHVAAATFSGRKCRRWPTPWLSFPCRPRRRRASYPVRRGRAKRGSC